MINISVTAQKAKARDPYAPLELENTGPVKLADTALLSDAQNSFLGSFITAHLPRKDHEAFRKSVLSRLSWGKPGEGAFRQAMRLAASEEFGFSAEQLTQCGLLIVQDRVDTRRAGAAFTRPRRWRKPKKA
jgi:hypothetical protein